MRNFQFFVVTLQSDLGISKKEIRMFAKHFGVSRFFHAEVAEVQGAQGSSR